ncbi:sigma-70 family RNA polymerase sigma factor [Oscillospiraceae bacterium MB08-C2-2]|nr:sigma-70 family RNA polymerase sigma factor [Oscillospiraceae bacterium MB08-C2-2]
MIVDPIKVEAARSGDKESFAQVYEAIAPDLYKVALYTLGNAHDAEDVVSETFIEAYKGIQKLKDVTSFKAWMMKILSIRCKRKIGEYVKGKNTYDIENFLTVITSGEDVSEQASEKITVLEAMQRLTSQERLILTLSVLEGYTTKEISSIMGTPHGTVSSKLHRTLAKLRKMLEPGQFQ